MYVDEKNLEGKKNASSDVITSSLYAFNYGGHVIRNYQWRTRIFSTEVFIRRRRPFINQHPFLTGKKKSSNSPVGVKILDDIWSLQSACF